ncbi:MAG: HAMP domain-containing sensor histidine kinase [Hyphomicrobiaceae bacterium]
MKNLQSGIAPSSPTAGQPGELVVDLARGLVVSVNEAGRALWSHGANNAVPALPWLLDAAMPALVTLRQLQREDGCDWPRLVSLVFWTPSGSVRFSCRVDRQAGDGTVVVRIVSRVDAADQSRPPAAGGHKDTAMALVAKSLSEEERAGELRHLAHELRTPLAAIASLAEALHGGYLGAIGNAKQVDYLESIRDTARHTLDVVEDMLVTRQKLAVSKASGGDSTGAAITDVGEIIDAVIDSMAELAGRSGAQIVRDTAAGPVLALVSPTALKQMLLNLVANAVTHGGADGLVKVRAAPGSAGVVQIDVTDTGAGIPADVIANVKTGRPAASGRLDAGGMARASGLGLNVTRMLAEAAGGTLELQSSRGGSLARVVLPAAPINT